MVKIVNFNQKQCKMISFRDISFLSVNAKLQADNKMLQLMSSTISHEMITPLSCMIAISERMKKT
jgi:signal transduction histidine kinase